MYILENPAEKGNPANWRICTAETRSICGGDASRNLQEQAMLFEMSCKKLNPDIDRSITLEKYTEIWLQTIAPDKLAKSTLVREKQDIERFKPYLGSYKLVDLRPEHFRSLYTKLRKQKNKANGKPLSEATVEGVHSCLCGILSDAMEGGYLDHNPAWRTYKYAGQKKEKKIADDEMVKKLIQALETVSILHETYFKLIIATGMRRGECCALKWEDINYAERSIHVCRNAVKTTGDEIIVKAPKTKAGNRYVYFSAEMESLLREYEAFCAAETERYDRRKRPSFLNCCGTIENTGQTGFFGFTGDSSQIVVMQLPVEEKLFQE